MITVLVVDDDPVVRSRALRYLARPEVQLASAADGRLGMEQAARLKPDVVICDVDMPGMDGFEVLAALRADASLGHTLVMMLTAESSRDSMRLGMTLGADDYLTKPFTGEELVTAFEALMLKRGRLSLVRDTAVREQTDYLRHEYAGRIESSAATAHDETAEAQPRPEDFRFADATVLCCELHDFTGIATRLTPDEIVNLLTEYCDRVSALAIASGSRDICFVGSRLVAVFADATDVQGAPEDAASAPQRALGAAASLAGIADAFAGWCDETFPDRDLTRMHIDVARYQGDIFVPADSTGGLGLAVAPALDSCAGWMIRRPDGRFLRLAALAPVDHAAPMPGPRDRQASTAASAVPVWEKTEVVPAATANGAREQASGAALHVLAVRNAHIATCAVKEALDGKLASVKAHVFADGQPPLYLVGYRLLRRIGSGGMSSVYVAIRERDDRLLVLKVLEPSGELIAEQMARFSREYTLLSRITHPNVIRIYNQGFSNDHAYIAMQYFENGDLRHRLNGPMAPAQAVEVALQVAQALCAIHALGIVHRDIKPENLMVRADGSVVLADFGIAKTVAAFSAGQSLLTQHGGLVGSPSYVSPEQIAGDELTPASDIYSLGVLFFELLTGGRPYQSSNVLSLLALHARAPIPLLPATLARYQSLIDRLMAKQPAERFGSAAQVAASLSALG